MTKSIAPFKRFTLEDAPAASVPYLEAAQKAFGLIPNIEQVMAQAPSLIGSYMTAWDLFDETSLNPAERQIVYQTSNFENNCGYCMPWHTLLAENAGLSADDVEALRNGAALSDPKQEALRLFARALVRTSGGVEPAALAAFFAAGYTEQSALEVVQGLAVKLMSNYTNAIAQIPLDEPAQPKAWKKPSLRG